MALGIQTYTTVAPVSVSANPWNLTINVPAGVQNGDLLIAVVAIVSSNVLNSPPGGWTQIIREAAGGGNNLYVFYKIAGSSEPASYTWNATANATFAGAMLRISGYDAVTAIDASAGAASSGSSLSFANPITQGRNANLILFITWGNYTLAMTGTSAYAIATNNPSWTQLFDLPSNTLDADLSLAYAIRSATGTTGNSSATINPSSTQTGGVLISINRATSVVLPNFVDTTVLSDAIKRAPARVIRDSIAMTDSVVATFGTLWANIQKTAANTWQNLTKS